MAQRIAGSTPQGIKNFLASTSRPRVPKAERKLSGLHRCDLAGPFTAPISTGRKRYHRCRICSRVSYVGTRERRSEARRAQD